MEEFIGKLYPQNCGDDLLVLGISKEKDKNNRTLYDVEFQKYSYKLSVNKQLILRGCVNNPQIEVVEFIQKEWPQNCGDTLQIIEKTNQRANEKGNILFRCQFKEYPYEVLATKVHIQEGCVNNPQIEQTNFVGKIFEQKGGDSVKVLRKTNQHLKNRQEFLFEVEFQKYPYKMLAEKCSIKNGVLFNPNLPWRNKNTLLDILKSFNQKPTLTELSKYLNISVSHIGQRISEFKLRDYIDYNISYSEKELRDYVSSLLNKTVSQYQDNKYEIDILIPNQNLGFEFNGNYWHSNIFRENNYHQDKSLYFKEKGIDLIHIWEWEWLEKQDICKALIRSKLGIFKERIFARKCKVEEISNREYQDFCNQNHIQGEAGAKVKLGLKYNKKLVQIMSFGVPRFSNNHEWEIIRECSKIDTIILGGKEKLWNYFVKKYNPKSCISYCEYSKFNGDSYIKLGFKKERLNKPGFWWLNDQTKKVLWRNPYKHQEYKNKGYLQIFDCGQLVFTWSK